MICDGAVRSGKTTVLSFSFVLWATVCFQGHYFALCGKTRTNIRRNLIVPLCEMLRQYGFHVSDYPSRNMMTISYAGHTNHFYIFGGKDESSAPLIQGITLTGVLLDEVALMPRSFVEQAIARCSVNGSRLWFSCNPDKPAHWFYQEWICRAKEKHALYLHFTMDDNPALSPAVRKRYQRLYSGAFYDRYVKGIWTAAQGLVYPMFQEKYHIASPPQIPDRYVVSCDYGTVNPISFGLWGECRGCWYRIAESYYDSRISGITRTDEEHYQALTALIGDRKIETIVIDPSAASLIACIRSHGEYRVQAAKNDVLYGIHRTADALRNGEIKIAPECRDAIREFSLYAWDEKSPRDQPIKENDHAMDDIRYFVATIVDHTPDDFFVAALERGNAF